MKKTKKEKKKGKGNVWNNKGLWRRQRKKKRKEKEMFGTIRDYEED